MVTVRRVVSDEVPLARELHNRFTAQDRSLDEVRSWYDAVPELFLFAVEDDAVLGVTTGRDGGDEGVSLAGIGVEPGRRAEGIGSQLLERFEANARDVGAERIGVASAGGYVDRFYVDAGFEPEQILVLNPASEPGDYGETPYAVRWDRREDGGRECYVDVSDHDEEFLSTVRGEFGDEEAIYRMAKRLTDG
jgi:GNAT superfamily N-acetyltransferase